MSNLTKLFDRVCHDNPGVLRHDGEVLFCAMCNENINAKQSSQVNQHLQTMKHLENVQKKTKYADKNVQNFSTELQSQDANQISMDLALTENNQLKKLFDRVCRENPGILRNDGEVLFCAMCNENINAKQNSQVTQHLQTMKHLGNVQQKMKFIDTKVQHLSTELQSPDRNQSGHKLDSTSSKCFICDVKCEAKDINLASNIAKTLSMPLILVLTKCLRTFFDEIENEYFCCDCIRKIEEYDRLTTLSMNIENELYHQFQNKPFKVFENQIDQREQEVVLNAETNDKTEDHHIALSIDGNDVIIKSEQNGLEDEPTEDEIFVESLTNEIMSTHPTYQSEYVQTIKKTKVKKDLENKLKSKRKRLKNLKISTNRLTCDICGRSYKSKGALGIHMVKHTKSNPHECAICKKVFTQRIGLQRHMPIHTGEQQHQCDICGKRFIHSASFNMHKKMHSDVRSKKCEICGSKFRSSSHITRHMRSHTGERPYACEICGQKFTQRYNMKTHRKTHHNVQNEVKTFKCLICMESFIRRDKLNEHLMQTHQAAIGSALSLKIS